METDLALNFFENGMADLTIGGEEFKPIDGKMNLVQALKLKLLIDKGEIAGLGHVRHGTKIRELIGEPLNRANLELLRRYVRKAILEEPRVKEIKKLSVHPKADEPGAVIVNVALTAIDEESVEFETIVNQE